MLAKIKRSKSDLSAYKDKPLQGMPALKQKRSSQRIENLMLKLPTSPNHTGLNEFERTGITSNRPMTEMKYIGVRPNFTHQHYLEQNQPKSKKQNILEKNKNIKKDLEVVIQRHDKPESNGISKKEAETNKSKGKKDKKKEKSGKAHGLHSIKKQRKATRESNVSTSMRALTPKERESIMFLESILSEQEGLDDLNEFGEDENVFKSNPTTPSSPWRRDEDRQEENGGNWGQYGSNLEYSDSSSVGSIIDLVGNLSDFRISSSSSRPTSENSNNNNYSRSHSSGIYEEIGSSSQPLRISAPPDFRDDVKADNKVTNEPIYSIVRKVKKTNLNTEPRQPAVPTEIEDKPTAKSSREFWNQMNKNTKETNGLNHVRSIKTPSSFIVRPKPPINNDNMSNSKMYIQSPGIELDEFGNLPAKSQVFTRHGNSNPERVSSYDTYSMSSSSGSEKSDIVAIPLQTISFYNKHDKTNPEKPFVLTSANRYKNDALYN